MRQHHTGDGRYVCPICNGPVKLDGAKCDEDGHAVHEDCYLKKIRGLIPPNPQKPPATQP